ncbi:MAG: protein kinase [Bryobacteraceae bacterium]|nr:protein kinase [Bryobacteraceae bacterium]MDW8377685.1 protein kinase [Bryobacterales bacterium]
MAGLGQNTRGVLFAGAAAALVTTYFALLIFTAWTTLHYGVKTVDLGWHAQKLGEAWYVSAVDEHGAAARVLQPGDRIERLNGLWLRPELNLPAMLAVLPVTTSYGVTVSRDGQRLEVYLRPQTRTGSSFFADRAPLVVASLLFFFAGLSMLLNWNSYAAQLGFLAAGFAALRMGCWAILPLSRFFEPHEHVSFFVFWLPAALAPAVAFHSLLLFVPEVKPSRGWRLLGGCLYALWWATFLPALVQGGVPAPTPDGFAIVHPGRIDWEPSWVISMFTGPVYLGVCVAAAGAWVWKLYRDLPAGHARSRLEWLLGAGLCFGLPAVISEIGQWMGVAHHAVKTSWMGGVAALAYSYVIAAGRLLGPGMVLRSVLAVLLPERLFWRLDQSLFKPAYVREQKLRQTLDLVRRTSDREKLQQVILEGLRGAFGEVEIRLNPEGPLETTVEVGPKPDGLSYTRRERRLLSALREEYTQAFERIAAAARRKAAEQSINLMRVCPQCGTCYDSHTVVCEKDGRVPAVTLPIERVIDGKYKLERLIGRGGMGAVYAGRDLRLDRRIAIKILLSELFGQETALKRFAREAQTVARLNHPNIIQVHDYGPIGAMGAYLVMEYAEGRTWRQELDLNRLSASVILPWVNQLLDAVEAAHEAGVIHRDLKPENLLLVDRGDGTSQLKILDFGLAKMQLLDLSRDDRLSLGVSAIGTVGYVPPEQLTGGVADARSDIYALGRILVESLSGSLPETGVEGIEEPLKGVLERCVAAKKEDRYPTIAHLRAELLPALSNYATVSLC